MIRAATRNEIELVAMKLPYPASPAAKGVLLEENDILRAMVIYDSWTNTAVQAHIYSTGPAALFSREFLEEIFGYPFIQCGKSIVYTVTPGDSEASLAVSKFLGFKETYRMLDGWDRGVDMVVKEMRKENCKYLKRVH